MRCLTIQPGRYGTVWRYGRSRFDENPPQHLRASRALGIDRLRSRAER